VALKFKSISHVPLPLTPSQQLDQYHINQAKQKQAIFDRNVGVTLSGQAAIDARATAPVNPKNKITLYKRSDSGVGFKQWSIWCEPGFNNVAGKIATTTQPVTGWNVITEWGKVGKTLQTNTTFFASEYEAQNAVINTIYKKKVKGYREQK
jgi:hypothetical protein